MDGLSLLRRAQDAGLAVQAEGDKLVIRGPKREGLEVDRGSRVHFDEAQGLSCIIAFGRRWRGEAASGLDALGIPAPEGFELF